MNTERKLRQEQEVAERTNPPTFLTLYNNKLVYKRPTHPRNAVYLPHKSKAVPLPPWKGLGGEKI
jgi:hypothetical protein